LCDQLLSAASAEQSAELVPGRLDLKGHASALSEDHGLVQRPSSGGGISGSGRCSRANDRGKGSAVRSLLALERPDDASSLDEIRPASRTGGG
jgi:hypothetical protein